ncbi:MAG: hypothetical protein IKO47_09470 [Ruminococcus sp.]|nr:hypothetical protein [Ruminococcus sp.]
MKIPALAIAAALLLALPACGKDNDSDISDASPATAPAVSDGTGNEPSAPEDTSAEPVSEKTTASTEAPASQSVLKNGAWYGCRASAPDKLSDFLIIRNGTILRTDIEYNIGSMYDFTVDGSTITAASVVNGDEEKITFTKNSDTCVTFKEEGFGEIVYTWFSDADPDTFRFMCNESIKAEASDYYGTHFNHVPEFVEVTDETLPGTVAVHLYDIIDSHASTCAWYYIDRFTGKGKDFLSEPVDINEKADIWNPDIPLRSELKQAGQSGAVMLIGHIDDTKNDIKSDKEYFNTLFANSGALEMFPFVSEITDLNYASTYLGTELYLVIPADDKATVEVSLYDFMNDKDSGTIFRSYNGAPVLVKCNYSDISGDVKIRINENGKDSVEFAPYISLKDGTVQSGSDRIRLIEWN